MVLMLCSQMLGDADMLYPENLKKAWDAIIL
jgi:hypothetical protein